MRAREFIIESNVVDAASIYSAVQSGHREPDDFVEGDIGDRIYWFDDYQLTSLPISQINLDEYYVDEDLVDDYIDHIKDSPKTMPPIVYDPIGQSVIDGIHRANAYAKLGYDVIPAYVGKTKSQSYGTRESDYDDEEIDEMALPADWDPSAFGHDKTFKSRLEYAKERSQRLGGGSSRVAFIIPDQGRDTVLKIAKNSKGLAQNEAELEILTDGYVSKLDIVIPLVDYDKENPQPSWIQTEKAEKASDTKLSKIMRSGRYLFYVVGYAEYLLGRSDWKANTGLEHMKSLSDEDAEIFREYATQLAEVLSATSLQAGDLDRAANWGLYNGKPVIIDLGYTESVAKLYWK